jgi:hypothetical protein
VKRCTCSILFQETQEFLWREKARVLGVILIDTRKQTQRERERERERDATCNLKRYLITMCV